MSIVKEKNYSPRVRLFVNFFKISIYFLIFVCYNDIITPYRLSLYTAARGKEMLYEEKLR